MRFKVHHFREGTRGLVTNIAVDAKFRRQGWATSLVEVLLELYPGVPWIVESPNEQSGQLFVHLAEVHAEQILPPLEDEAFPRDDRRRYGTRPFN